MEKNPLNDLIYTKECIAEFWDSEDYRIFTVKKDDQGNLIMLSSNKTNARLYNCEEDCTGKNIYEFMEKEHADRWHARFYKWKASDSLVSYIAFFQDTLTAWDTTIEVIGNTIFGIGRKIKNKQIQSIGLGKYEFFNHFTVEPNDITTFLLEYTPEGFIIESDDRALLKLEKKSTLIGENVTVLMKYCSNLLDLSVFYKCIETQKVIKFLEIYESAINSKKQFFETYLIPLCSCTKILVYLKKVDENTYTKLQNNMSDTFNVYLESNLFGVCELNVENTDNIYLIGSNSYFKELIHTARITLEDLKNTSAFKECMQSGTTTSSHLEKENQKGERISYLINTAPMLSDAKVSSILFTISPEKQETEKIQALMAQLTPREKEILTYVVDGCTNRYIAAKLGISEGTVKKTIYNCYQKLGITSRIELAKIFYSR